MFEQQVATLKTLKLDIPDLILAIKLLKGVNLPENEKKMARLACKTMTFEEAKNSLLAMTDDVDKISSKNGVVSVKREQMDGDTFTFYNEENVCTRCQSSFNLEDQGEEVMCNSQKRYYQSKGRGPIEKKRRCFRCGSLRHWVKECPEKIHKIVRSKQDYNNSNHPPNRRRRIYYEEVDESESEDEQPTDESSRAIFFQSDVGNEVEDILLVGQTINQAVLDCGASQTVCGTEWYQCYLDSLGDEQLNQITESPSSTVFKFGVGSLKALKQASIPVTICGRNIFLSVQIVKTDIPLLLSLSSMKKLGMNLDLPNDRVIIKDSSKNKKIFKLNVSTTGHYVIPIMEQNPTSDIETENETFKQILVEETSSNQIKNKSPQEVAMKLHRRFAHASSNQLIRLLNNANIKNKAVFDELKNVEKICEFCTKHKRASPLPSVSIPLAYSFNEMVSMDLKQINNKWVLHCIDYVTRFSAAHPVKDKSPEEIIEKFFMIWISIFGPPKKVFSDNGGEFIGDKTIAMCNAFNIEPKFTASESPFSNGICERHNALIGSMTEKVIEDIGCKLSIALMWATHAKNSLINVFGFSPYQLVFGHNPNIPGNQENKLPALTSTTSYQIVADHLNSLHKAREAYIQAENSDRIRRALIGRIFNGTHQKFCVGDRVYYKRADGSWHGPGYVIAQNGCQVLVKTGSRTLIKVHPCKIILKEEADNKLKDTHSESTKQPKHQKQQSANEEQYVDEEICNDGITHDTEESSTQAKNDNGLTLNDQSANSINDQIIQPKSELQKMASVKAGDHITFRESEEDDWKSAIIQSRAGKAGGKHSSWYNVKRPDETKLSINLDTVDWKFKEGIESAAQEFSEQHAAETLVLTSVEKNENKFTLAKQTEIDNWKKFKVFSAVQRDEYPDVDVLSCRWVTEAKQKEEGIQYRARLVVRGFEELDAPQADSPTANKCVIRMFLAICNMLSYNLKSLDVKTAFLQSDFIERVVLIKPPKEFREDSNTVWKLNKFVYGLNDAARVWFLTVRKKLTEFGCKAIDLDNSVFVLHHQNKLSGFAVIHVDDFLIGGDALFHEKVIKKLEQAFIIGSQKIKDFKFIGWNVCQYKSGIYVDQIDYQQSILPVELEDARKGQVDYELNCEEKKNYQGVLGKLQWITSQSRPDLRFAALELSTRAGKPTVADVIKLNAVVRKLKKRSIKIMFPSITPDSSNLKIYAFADAALSNLPDRISSTRGSVIFLVSENKASVLSWASKKIQRVVKDVINAECIALSLCIDEAMVLRDAVLQSLLLNNSPKMVPIYAFTDSKSLWANIHSTNQASDLKLRREVQCIR